MLTRILSGSECVKNNNRIKKHFKGRSIDNGNEDEPEQKDP